jgi:alpha-tubulin suppressor-like RCC1 family protein
MHTGIVSRHEPFLTVSTRTIALTLAIFGALISPAMAGPTSTTLSGTPEQTTYGETVEFNARVDGGGPSGTVTFMDGAKELSSSVLGAVGAQSSLAAGDYHTCALTNAGGVQCWGDNNNGELGDGNAPTDRHTPVPVTGLSSGVAAVAAGDGHTCALTDAGAVLCWGYNGFGQLGDGTITNRSIPVAVTGLSSGVSAIAAGGIHTCALTNAGAVKCWGRNFFGQLGDGTTTERHTPVPVVGLSNGGAAIVAGYDHTCALTGAGAVKCWGRNNYGQLGDGTLTDRHTRIPVTGLSSGVAAIASGEAHTCAVTDANAVKCWGYNGDGQLGDNSTTDRHTPVPVNGLSSEVAAIAAGGHHTCALTDAGVGTALCWGRNSSGELGDNSTIDRHTPVPVIGLSSGVSAISAGYGDTCALTDAGAGKCWGGNGDGQLGDNSTTARHTPVGVVGIGPGMALVPAEAVFSTAKLNAGTRPIIANYNGDALNDASTSTVLFHVVEKGGTTTKIKTKPKKPTVGNTVRLKIKVKSVAPAVGKPKGKAVIKDGRKKLGKFKVKKGKAKIKLRSLSAGTHKIKAKFRGDKNWNKSKAKKKVKVR